MGSRLRWSTLRLFQSGWDCGRAIATSTKRFTMMCRSALVRKLDSDQISSHRFILHHTLMEQPRSWILPLARANPSPISVSKKMPVGRLVVDLPVPRAFSNRISILRFCAVSNIGCVAHIHELRSALLSTIQSSHRCIFSTPSTKFGRSDSLVS